MPDFHARLGSIVRQLEALQAGYESSRDSRCVFTLAYAHMTRRIDASLDATQLFDPGWIVSLAEAFFARYLVAIEAYDRGTLASAAWISVLDAICKHNSSVLEDLTFPITAHIVHDLPQALCDVGFTSAGRLHDYDAVNEMMGKAMDEIRDAVTRRYSPGLRWLDRIERQYDQIFSDYGIRMSRGLAWYNAQRLLDPNCRPDALQAIERSPRVLVDAVRRPPVWSTRFVFSLARGFVRLFRVWPSPS